MTERIVFFDLETGGLDPARHPVIQFAGIALESWEEIDSLEIKIKVDPRRCEREALQINSYDPELWGKEGIGADFAVEKISDFLRRHATAPMVSKRGKRWRACQLAGHNAASFDRPFLGKLFDSQKEFCVGSLLVLDTLQLAVWWFQGMAVGDRPANYKLAGLCEFLGIPLTDAHDALADVRATVKVARLLTDRAWASQLGGAR